MSKNYCWCSKGLEPDYVDCEKCAFSLKPESCCNRNTFHSDAIRFCDDKRKIKGLSLISDDFSLVKENFRKKEIVLKQEAERQQVRLSEQLKKEAMQRGKTAILSDNMNVSYALIGVAVCIILGFPVSYIGQLCQIFTMFFFDTARVFLSSDPYYEIWSESFRDSFFHADFAHRYYYWTAFLIAIFSWMFYEQDRKINNVELVLRAVGSLLYSIAIVLSPGLFISTIIGPIFILFGLFITIKR